MRRTAAIVSGVAAAVLLALTTPAAATAAPGDSGFLCGITGGTGGESTPLPGRRGSDDVCAVVVLPDIIGRGAPFR